MWLPPTLAPMKGIMIVSGDRSVAAASAPSRTDSALAVCMDEPSVLDACGALGAPVRATRRPGSLSIPEPYATAVFHARLM
jgi:hypothetical protein